MARVIVHRLCRSHDLSSQSLITVVAQSYSGTFSGTSEMNFLQLPKGRGKWGIRASAEAQEKTNFNAPV